MTKQTMPTTPINVDETLKNVDATIDEKIDAMKTRKTFSLASLARVLGRNEKIVRSRFRRYARDENDVERAKIVNMNFPIGTAKSRWVYPIECIDAIVIVVKRHDDE